jgi:hypothetical protein
MSKKRIFNNVNVLGNFYLDNPENRPERSFVTGPGSDRPVWFTQSQFAKLFWRHRTFTCSAFGILPTDAFGAFLGGGGTAGGIIGATAGIGAAIGAIQASVASFSTQTKVSVLGRSKVRVTLPGINDGITQGKAKIIGTPKDPNSKNPLNLDDKLKNVLGSFRNDVNEGSAAIGSYHFGQNNNGFLSIDFSDVVVTRGQYWPRVILMFGPALGMNGPAFSSVLRISSLDGRPERDLLQGGPWNLQTIGGIAFEGNVIQMFGNNSFPNLTSSLAIINGSISTVNRNACATMNWDTFEDSARIGNPGIDDYKEEDCKKIFREDRGSSSSST